MRFILITWLSLALAGCSMCGSEAETAEHAVVANEPPQPIAASERTVLANQLGFVRDDQRARSSQYKVIAERAAVRENPRTQRISRDISKRQLQIALVTERTDRYIRNGDAKAAAYERELGRLLAEQHRAIRVLLAALEALQLAEEIALASELEAEYARSIVAYETFDDTWDYSVRDAPEDFFVEIDVMDELDRVPEHEVHFAFAMSFEQDDYAYYADECEVELPETAQLVAWAELGSFDAVEVEEREYEYVDLSFEYQEIAELEEQYELEPPEYYDELIADEPDFDEQELSVSFDTQDDAMETIFDTDPEELADEHGEYFEASDEAEVEVQVDVLGDDGEVEVEDVGETVEEETSFEEETEVEVEAEVEVIEGE